MTIQRLSHVGIVVDDLAAATEFFVELGLVLQQQRYRGARGVMEGLDVRRGRVIRVDVVRRRALQPSR